MLITEALTGAPPPGAARRQYLRNWNPFTSDTAIATINTNTISTFNNDPFHQFPHQSALERTAGTQTRRLCRWRALSEACRGRPGAVLARRGHGRRRACGRGRDRRVISLANETNARLDAGGRHRAVSVAAATAAARWERTAFDYRQAADVM